MAYLGRKSSHYSTLLFTARLTLAIGVCFAWLAVLAGELAASVVEKTLCKPGILEDHSTLAYTASILFTAGLILDCSRSWIKRSGLRKLLIWASSLLLALAVVLLIGTAFFGGKLVYEQGAAVENGCSQPS